MKLRLQTLLPSAGMEIGSWDKNALILTNFYYKGSFEAFRKGKNNAITFERVGYF